MSIGKLTLWVLVMGTLCANIAQASPAVPVVQVFDARTGEELHWHTTAQWKFVPNADKAQILRAKVQLDPPAELAIRSVHPESNTVNAKVKDGHIVLLTGAMKGRLTLGGATINAIEIRIAPPRPAVLVSGCEPLGVHLVAKESLPFFVGAKCVKRDSVTELHLTMPEESDLDQSSLFEKAGKGERWRVYELGKTTAGTQDAGNFTIRYGDKPYHLNLIISTKNQKDESKHPFDRNFSFGLGYTALKLTGDASGSDSKFLLLLRILPMTLWHGLGAGADLSVAFGLSSSPKSINELQFAPYGFYRLVDRPNFTFDPRIYYVMVSEQQAGTGVGFQTNQVGAGFMLAYRILPTWFSHLEIRIESLGSQVIQSHDYIDVGVNQIQGARLVRWGGGVQLQSYSVKGSDSHKYKFDQTSAYVALFF